MTACLLFLTLAAADADVASQIETILTVQPRAENQAAASKAAVELADASPEALPTIAAAIGDGHGLADNALRGAFETIVAAADAAALPLDELRDFYADRSHDPRARRMVFELLRDRDALDGVEPQLDDPSEELRFDAVKAALDAADALPDDDALAAYRAALAGATDRDQVDRIAKRLEAAGEPVDRVAHYGYLTRYRLIGPFDNRDEASFDRSYPPEERPGDPAFDKELASDFEGFDSVGWQTFDASGDEATLNLHDVADNYKGSLVYLATAFEADAAGPIQLRLSTENAFKIWLNGEPVFARPEYHRSKRFDQYVLPAEAREGRNLVFIKLLQNEQEQSWAQEYDVSVRVTDPTGIAADIEPILP